MRLRQGIAGARRQPLECPHGPAAPRLHPCCRATVGNPFTLLQPAEPSVPVVFASAHSGQDYGSAFVASVRLDPLGLRRSEDSFRR